MAGSDYDMSLILGAQKNIKHKKAQILCFMFYVYVDFEFWDCSNNNNLGNYTYNYRCRQSLIEMPQLVEHRRRNDKE